eukprot:SAG25_NODE_47_length_18954_cov_11.266295_4_plen_40_part_00
MKRTQEYGHGYRGATSLNVYFRAMPSNSSSMQVHVLEFV